MKLANLTVGVLILTTVPLMIHLGHHLFAVNNVLLGILNLWLFTRAINQ